MKVTGSAAFAGRRCAGAREHGGEHRDAPRGHRRGGRAGDGPEYGADRVDPDRPSAGGPPAARARRARRARDPTPSTGCAGSTHPSSRTSRAERAWYDVATGHLGPLVRGTARRDDRAGFRLLTRQSVGRSTGIPTTRSSRREGSTIAIVTPVSLGAVTAISTDTALRRRRRRARRARSTTAGLRRSRAAPGRARTSGCWPTRSTTTGDEVYELRFRDLRTGRRTCADVVPAHATTAARGAPTRRTSSTPCTTRPTGPYQVWRHRLGTPVADDVLVLEEPRRAVRADGAGHPQRRAVVIWSREPGHQRGVGRRRHATRPRRRARSAGGGAGVEYHAEHVVLPDGATRCWSSPTTAPPSSG